MSIPNGLFGKKGISLMSISAMLVFTFGMAMDNKEAISQSSEDLLTHIISDTAKQSAYDVKLDSIFEYVKDDSQNNKELREIITKNHQENKCFNQQLKDLIYKVPETNCT